MLENFQLAAIVKEGTGCRLLSIPMLQSLQHELGSLWQEQYNAFVGAIHEIDYVAGYTPEPHERFVLGDYEPPDWLADENSRSVASLDSITDFPQALHSIRSIVAFVQDEHGEETVLFQRFSPSKVIKPGRFLLLQHGTYRSTANPGLTLDGKLSAVYQPAKRKLLFHNFRNVNAFLPLFDIYREATENEIKEVLSHTLLAPQDADALATDSNQWFRTRFAMLKDSPILEQYSANQIKASSSGYDVEVQVENNQIIFPADRSAARKLLQFLNEERFRGAITNTLYETNSKRKAE